MSAGFELGTAKSKISDIKILKKKWSLEMQCFKNKTQIKLSSVFVLHLCLLERNTTVLCSLSQSQYMSVLCLAFPFYLNLEPLEWDYSESLR